MRDRTGLNVLRRRTEREGLREAPSYIYLIDDGVNVKIGYAVNPYERLRLLQTGNCEELRLVAAFAGTRQHEAELHELFSGFRVRGEWFLPDALIIDFFTDATA